MSRSNHDAVSSGFDPSKLIDIDIDALRKDFCALRRRCRMSQLEVAGVLEVSQATISAFEQGKHHRIRSKTLRGLWDIVALWKRKGANEAQNSKMIPDVTVVRRTGPPADGFCGRCGAPLNSLGVPTENRGGTDVRIGILRDVLGWIERGESLDQLVHELSQLTLHADDKVLKGC